MTSNTPDQSSGNKKFWAHFICYVCGIWLVIALFCVFRNYDIDLDLPLYAFSPHNPGGRWIGDKLVLGSLEAIKQARLWAICTGLILLFLVVGALRTQSLAAAIVMILFLGLLSVIGLCRALTWAEELD